MHRPESAGASHLDDLNPGQRAAVTYGIPDSGPVRDTPPLLVIAGAGTGKTKTLAHRVAHLILNGAHPGRILLLTFARRMAQEMTRRVERICATAFAGRASVSAGSIEWSGTFHAIGARLLRMHAQSIGLTPGFSILDRSDAADLMDLVRDELRFSETKGRFPKKATCLSIYSFAVNAQAPLEDVLARTFPWCIEWQDSLRRLFAAYVDAKQAQAVLDYDDLLLYWAQMMQIKEIAEFVSSRFDHVLVDEYQDTNALQASILFGLKPQGTGLTVVGDDAQSIYSFRSARVKNILEFPSRFAPAAEIIKLERNYRSAQPILDGCNRIIGHAAERFTKNLFSDRTEGNRPAIAMVADETAQVEFVIERVLANREAGLELREQAVLFRTSHHSGQLEVELTRRGIPFVKFGGLKFLEAAHVKDLLSALRWVENPRDRVAGFRVLKLLPGVGPATARRVLASLEGEGHSLASLARCRPAPGGGDMWTGLVEALSDLSGTKRWEGQIERLRRWYDPMLERIYDSPRVRLGDLDQLERMASQHASRTAFLTDLTLDPPEASGDEAGAPAKDDDWLVLATIHSAKGQEWRAVLVLNVVDGCIPSDLATGTPAEIEEERRLLYVAMTRARDDLVLMQPLRFFVRGQALGADRHIYAPRSRFIAEADLDAFDLIGLAAQTPASAPDVSALPRVDLKGKMRRMWG
ncbi:MAG: ATP-dependent helicase [Betaproteobacteria bacterium]|nr:ATP-dependent helicase [Betaproteobacteria bacterium]